MPNSAMAPASMPKTVNIGPVMAACPSLRSVVIRRDRRAEITSFARPAQHRGVRTSVVCARTVATTRIGRQHIVDHHFDKIDLTREVLFERIADRMQSLSNAPVMAGYLHAGLSLVKQR